MHATYSGKEMWYKDGVWNYEKLWISRVRPFLNDNTHKNNIIPQQHMVLAETEEETARIMKCLNIEVRMYSMHQKKS